MIETPDIFFLVKGESEGGTELNVFDNCLLKAGIGNTNLLKMSSIIPPECIKVSGVKVPEGSLLPIAYSFIYSEKPGSLISAAIAVAIPEDPSLPGLIMEHSGYGSLEKIGKKAYNMAVEGFNIRGFPIKEIIVEGIEHRVVKKGGTFAAAALWYRDKNRKG